MHKLKKSLRLPVHGQVTYLFTTPLGSEIPAKFKFTNKSSGKIKIEISNENFDMSIQTEKTKPTIQINSKTGLIPAKNVFYWVSLDSQHQAIKFGIGEARPETVKFSYNLLKDCSNLQQPESLSIIKNISNIQSIKLLRDPIINPVHSQLRPA